MRQELVTGISVQEFNEMAKVIETAIESRVLVPVLLALKEQFPF
jgi:hypothetical protein